LMGAISVLVIQIRRPQPAADPVQFTIGAPDNWLLAGDAFTGGAPDFSISPDGRHVAVRAFSQGLSMLWVRSTTKPPWRRLEGTEGASSPFWSPDSQSIGFFASEALPPGDSWLKTVRVSGGLPVELCRVPHGERSATWSRHGVIVFGGSGVLQKIPSGGGKPTPVTKLENGENAHRWPWFLPDDEHFLYLAHRSGVSQLRVGSLTSTDTWSSLGPFESNAVYAQGHLIFMRSGKFTAQPFDPVTRQLAGDPVILADQTAADELLVKSEGLATAPDWSPDGRFLVYVEQVAATGYDLWTLSLSGERTKSVFLQTAYDEASGTFSPDGRWIAYESNASGRNQVYVRPFPVRDGQFPISRDGGRAPRWSANGKELFFLTPDGMLMAVGIDTTKAFTATVPQPLFRTGLTHAGSFHPYAVAKDGRRFLIPVPHETPGAMPITVVLNWPATLGK
jgi:Tol biopolymer transport system component